MLCATRLAGPLSLAVAFASVCSAQAVEIWRNSDVIFANEGQLLGGSVDVDGDSMIVGVAGLFSGAFIFRRDEGEWTQVARFLPDELEGERYFGKAAAISGNTAVVGYEEATPYGRRSGAAYVFSDDGSGWRQVAKLVAPDGRQRDRFGTSVEILDDTILVGASGNIDRGEGDSGTGSVYVFQRTDMGWGQTAKLVPADPSRGSDFGASVGLSGDTAVIGSPTGVDYMTGGAYIFQRSGNSWQETALLQAAQRDPRFTDLFGTSVAIDGDVVAVGAPWGNGIGRGMGSARVFQFVERVGWVEQAEIVPDVSWDADGFGDMVAVDEGTVAVRSQYLDGDNGAVYVYEDDGFGWTRTAKLDPPDTSGPDDRGPGIAVDGNTIFVGAPGHDGAGPNAGAVYVFTRGEWPEVTLRWDGLGEGDWAYRHPLTGKSRWVDEVGLPLDMVPYQDAATVLRIDTVTVSSPQTTGTLAVESGTLKVTPAGSLEVVDTVSFANAATYAVELDGPDTGQITAEGEVQLADGATLLATALGPLETVGPQSRTILATTDRVFGTFFSAPTAGDELGYGVFVRAIDYEPDRVDLALFQALPGDTDGDAVIDNDDLQRILAADSFNNGPGYTWTAGDFDGNGAVTNADLQLILATGRFNTGPYAATAAAVPEPGIAALLFAAMLALLATAGLQRRFLG